jgi:hypothetical protein
MDPGPQRLAPTTVAGSPSTRKRCDDLGVAPRLGAMTAGNASRAAVTTTPPQVPGAADAQV